MRIAQGLAIAALALLGPASAASGQTWALSLRGGDDTEVRLIRIITF